VDAQSPQIVALLRGPLALFGVGNLPANFSRAQLLAAAAASQSSDDWVVKGDAGKITFRPFAAIGDETYRLYHKVEV
jgi:Na+-transporting NADH:ubiquinone oxidoreductase subunit NqrB